MKISVEVKKDSFNIFSHEENRLDVCVRTRIYIDEKRDYFLEKKYDADMFTSLFDTIWQDIGKRLKKEFTQKENPNGKEC